MELTIEIKGYGYEVTAEPVSDVREWWRFYLDFHDGHALRLCLSGYARVEGKCVPGHPTCRHRYFRKGEWDDEEHAKDEMPPIPDAVAEAVRAFVVEHISRGIIESPITVGGY